MTKYLKLFTNYYETDSYENGTDYIEPYVSLTESIGGGGVNYNLVPSIILTMRDSSKIKLYNIINISLSILNYKNHNIQYNNVVKMELSNEITSITELMFCLNLESINIPNSVTRISPNAFNFISNLTSISIPSSIKSIEKETFSSCQNLSSVTLTDSITSIDKTAFKNDLYIHELKIIGKKNISNLLPHELTDNLTNLYVDASLVETYKTFRDSIGKTFEVKPLN